MSLQCIASSISRDMKLTPTDHHRKDSREGMIESTRQMEALLACVDAYLCRHSRGPAHRRHVSKNDAVQSFLRSAFLMFLYSSMLIFTPTIFWLYMVRKPAFRCIWNYVYLLMNRWTALLERPGSCSAILVQFFRPYRCCALRRISRSWSVQGLPELIRVYRGSSAK